MTSAVWIDGFRMGLIVGVVGILVVWITWEVFG